MSTVNINKNVSDPFYRYKMPRLIAKIEGRGNGIKTVLVNMTEISKSLRRPPSYPTKFMGIELGAQVIIDPKNDRYVVNGAHDVSKVQDVLYDFIAHYILCPKCENPETDLTAYIKKEKIKINCIACGYNAFLERTHRLDVFIMKNPPPSNASAANYTSNSASKPLTSIPSENLKSSSMDENSIPKSANHINGTEKAKIEFFTDTSSKAVAERLNQLSLNASLLATNPDLEKPTDERLNIFYNFAKDNIQMSNDNASKIVIEAKRLLVLDTCPAIIAELLFSDGLILKKLISHKKLLAALTSENRVSQMNLLGGIELIMSKFASTVVPQTLKILKLLYQFEIIEEEVFLEWDSKRSTKFITDVSLVNQIHTLAKPFIDWLKTADVESEEDSDVDIEFTKEEQHILPVVSSTRNAPPVLTREDEEELNIDDI